VIDTVTGNSTAPVPFANPYLDSFFWAPDSSRVFATFTWPLSIVSSDLNGVGNTITFEPGMNRGWFDGWVMGKILMTVNPAYSTEVLVLVNPADGSVTRIDSLDIERAQIEASPDRTRAAVGVSLMDIEGYWSVDNTKISLLDSDGNASVIAEHTVDMTAPLVNGITTDFVWSQDGSSLAYVDTTYDALTGAFVEELVVHDVRENNAKRTVTNRYDCGPSSASAVAFSNISGGQCHPTNKIRRILGWMKDKVNFIIETYEGVLSFNSENGITSNPFPTNYVYFVQVSPQERYLTYEQSDDGSGGCYPKGNNQWAVSSLLNLTADVRATKSKTAVTLRGIAADKNLSGYQLEYADTKSPADWNLISPPTDIPVVNDKIIDWVPPSQSTYLVRMTGWDKAGNSAISRQKVVWGLASAVTNLYLSQSLISPNNDGTKDTVALNYRVLEAVHLEFNVVNSVGNVVRTFVREHLDPTSTSIVWDGRDEAGNVVPDGKYLFRLFDYEFPVEVDTTPPDVALKLGSLWNWWDFRLTGHAVDININNWIVEFGAGENPSEWYEFTKGTDILAARDVMGKPILEPKIADATISQNPGSYSRREWSIDEIIAKTGMRFKITSSDFAGNVKSYLTEVLPEVLVINGIDSGGVSDLISVKELASGAHTFRLFETIRTPLTSIRMQYKLNVTDSTSNPPVVRYVWTDTVVRGDRPSEKINIQWLPSATPENASGIRFVATAENGLEYISNEIKVYVPHVVPPPPPGNCPILFGVGPEVADCEQVSGKISFGISTPIDGQKCSFLPQMKKVHMFVVKPDGTQQLLKEYTDALPEMTGTQLEDSMVTTGYPEGTYKLKAVVEYVDFTTGLPGTTSLTGNFQVDRVLPEGSFLAPAEAAQVCPVTTSDMYGQTFYEVELAGQTSDNMKVDGYETYYGIGDKSVLWNPAMTRVGTSISSPNGVAWIKGEGAVNGQLGYWDVTGLLGKAVSTRIKVIDGAGNAHCVNRSFSIRNKPELSRVSADKRVFSSLNDKLKFSYSISEELLVSVDAYQSNEKGESIFVAAIFAGLQQGAGQHQFEWDGRDISGNLLGDGAYQLYITAKSACGVATRDGSILVEIDNTAPDSILTYPLTGDPIPLGNTIEILGTSKDAHFSSYTLEVGEGSSPTEWSVIKSGQSSVDTGVLGIWNTFGLSNIWTVRLTTVDVVGNESSVLSVFDLGIHKNLVKTVQVAPGLISPNNDQKLDRTTITYEVTAACNVKIDVLDTSRQIVKTFVATTSGAEVKSVTWDGKGADGLPVRDGSYTFRLVAALIANPQITQSETLTLIVDTTPPTLNVINPEENTCLNKMETSVFGSITDLNLSNYKISMAGPSVNSTLDLGAQNQTNYNFGSLSNLAEGAYSITTEAQDRGENAAKLVRNFIIDRTPPKVTLESPKADEFYGNSKNVINVVGSVVELNLEQYSLRYGIGDAPTDWREVVGGKSVPVTTGLYSWKVGKDDGIADGVYTLSLYAKDRAGLEGEAKVRLVVDNTLPEVAITAPKDGSYITKATNITGTVSDANLDKGLLELSSGTCATAAQWVAYKTITSSVREGVIDTWKLLPADGDYCLRLSAVDKSGNKSSSTLVVFKIDTQPPSAPVLSGKTENKTSSRLTWTKSPEEDVTSYNVYRNGMKVTAVPNSSELTYLEEGVKEGSYVYTVKAVDRAGNESASSNAITLKIDLTGPSVRIVAPGNNATVSNLVGIKGTAYSENDFKEYRIYIGQGTSPVAWNLIRRSPVPLSFGPLATWDTMSSLEGSPYTIKLEGEDLSGNISTAQATVTIDNTSPKTPVLLTAVANGADVTVTWEANGEADLAGYLLYLNDQLANVNGNVAGNLKPYLIAATSYTNKFLPDGTYRYVMFAMDQAGNMSDQSNPLEVIVDSHPPHMVVTAPVNGQKFDGKLTINAETPDNDIATVQFQYKHPQDPDTAWIDLGQKFVKAPYITYFDPKANSLSYGDFQLRAFATDQHNNYDLTPQVVTVTYTDLTPPDVPSGLATKVNGADVNLTWTAVSEAEVSYNIYRWSGGTKSKANSVPVKTALFTDAGVPDGTYQYEITAIDVAGNESKASGQVTAKIYAPIITQPFTPVKESALNLTGSGVDPGAPVQMTTTLPSGATSSVTVNADSTGAFRLEGATLVLGENRFTATATDSAGNISRSSETIVVVYDVPPAVPTGLAAAVQGYDVQLTWDSNRETVLGYNVYRDGNKLNQSVLVTDGQTTDSYNDFYGTARYAIDGNYNTSWSTPYGYGTFTPVWWKVTLPAPEVISQVAIQWGAGWDSVNNIPIVLGGKDYELQAWTGYNWVTLKKVIGNDQQYNQLGISPPYRTDQLRIAISSTTDPTYSKYVQINEVNISKDVLVQPTAYADLGLWDDRFNYTISAVDQYGFESTPTSPVEAIVGDVIPPAAPTNLQATVRGADVILDWSTTPNTEPDLAGYYIYRQNGQEWDFWGDVSNTTTNYTDTYLPNGIYHYKITAYDFAYNESVPSNDASATVAVAPPSNPPVLSVTAPPEGKTIIASWPASGGTTVGYNVYRSLTSGGGYIRITPSPIQELTFKDIGLTNGTSYYYVVTACDALGNESVYSVEAVGVPRDLFAPDRPVIFSPIKSGEQLVVYKNDIDVGGIAEPGSAVELLRAGDILGNTTSLAEDIHTTKPFGIDGYVQGLSPDGDATVFNDNNGALWYKKLDSGSTTKMVDAGWSAGMPVWSPDGGKVAYSRYDTAWNYRVAVYDIASATSTFLTEDSGVYENSQSWSGDGTKIAFLSTRSGTYDIWLKNLADNSLLQVATNVNASKVHISPDASKIAYFSYQNLFLVNISDGIVKQLDDSTDQFSFAWTRDSNKIAFVSYRDGDKGLFVTDLTTQVTNMAPGSSGNGFSQPAWSPDSTRMVYSQYTNYGYSLRMIGLSGEQTTLLENLSSLDNLEWVNGGTIAFSDGSAAHALKLKGTFTIPKVQLGVGENKLYAIANDDSGNTSPPSDSITVVFDTGHLPDLVISDSDISIYPPYPKPGEDVLVTARIHNPTANAVDNIKAELYLWDGSNAVMTLASESNLHIDANGEGTISARFNAGTAIGNSTLIAIADPDDTISELLENNNYGSKDLIVSDQEKVTITNSLNAAQYAADQDLYAQVKLRNSGLPKTGTLSVSVEDASGNSVKLLTSQAVDLPYGTDVTQAFTWNTSTTFSGAYRLHATISDGSTVLAEDITPFTIMPDLRVSAGIITDRQQYGARQDVGLAVSFKNIGVNYLIPQLRARVRVLGTQNTELYSGEQTSANLMPGATGSLPFNWNTGLIAPGPYTATLDIFAGDKLVTSASASFSIIPSVSIGGSIKADPAVAVLGSSFTANYSLSNNGNAGASGTAQVSLIDQDTSTIVATTEQATILPLGGTVPGNAIFTTDGLKLKNYLLKLNFLSNGGSTVIATTPLSIKDGTPPVLTVSTLVDGSHTSSSVLNIAGTVTDNIGVKQLLINGVSVPFGPDGIFSHALLLKPGENRVEVKATDLAGNSASDNRTIYLDQKAPVLVVTSPADNSKTNTQQIDVTGHLDETSTVEVRVNGVIQPVTMDGNNFTASVTLLPGAAANTIDITATNLAMKSSSDKRSVYYDDQAPALAIIAPGQDIRTNQANLTIRGTASDSYGFGVTVSLDVNEQKFTPQLIDGKFEQAVTFTTEDTYHIVATATNEMGTSTSVQRNVIYDITPPAFTIDKVISPTNQQSQVISGTRDADATVTVSCITVTVGPVEYSTSTTWKVSLSSLTVGDNIITATATDGAGNPNSLPVHIIYDTTPPTGSILINSGASFTASTRVALSLNAVDANSVTSMRLSNDGITWTDPENYATTRIWNLLPGDGQKNVYVQYKDAAENWSADSITASIVLDTTPPIVTTTPAGGTYNTTQTVLLTANEAATIYYTTNGSIPTTASAVYREPLTIASSTTLKCLAIDSAGNQGTHTESYVIDTIPPTGTISINAGATITNSSQVTLTLAASDASGVTKMRFSNDNSTWSDSENYATTRGWFLPSGDGAKQVFVGYQDLAGNWSAAPIVASIVLDATPPTITTTPAGGVFNTSQAVHLTTNEPAIIYYSTDGSNPTTSSAVYSGLVSISSSSNLNCLVIDSAGHRVTYTESYIIDTIPPVVSVSTLPNGSYTNNEVLNVTGRVTDNIGTKELLINGVSVPVAVDGAFSQALILKPGANQVNVFAADLATNSVSDTRTINLDQTIPKLTITAPSDNIKTNQQFINVNGYVDEPNTVVEISIKGVPQAVARDGNNFTATVALVPGANPNTIDIIATDQATNSSSNKRSVYYDDKSPALAITMPLQDIRTNLANLAVKGTASDPYGFGVAVSLDVNGQKFTPLLIAGKFEQAISFTVEDTYNVVATATNDAGTSTSVQRNVIFDVTPPALTIDPVTSPTTTDSQLVSGTRESGLDVTVSSSTATLGVVTYPSSTTWQVSVTSLKSGSNIITATSIDAANNGATASKEIVFAVSTTSGNFSTAIFGNTKVTMSGGSYTDSYINTPSCWVKGNNKNGDVGTNSLQSCSIQMSGGVQVFGKGWVGHGGNPTTVECLSGGSTISGASAALLVAKDMTPKIDPSGGTSLGAIALSAHRARTLTPGNWRVSSISLSGGSTLTLNGPLMLHVDGNLALSGNSSIVIASGAVTIYQNGQKLDISGGSIVNSSKAPANLLIYGTAGLQTMNLSGGTDLHALVYAPTAAIKLSGGQSTFGSVIGNTVDISGGSSVHYDESLRN